MQILEEIEFEDILINIELNKILDFSPLILIHIVDTIYLRELLIE